MARSIVAGLTDYSTQTISEMSEDLNEWNLYLTETCEILKRTISELQESGYWESVFGDFSDYILYCIDFFERSNKEISEINKEIGEEVQTHHVTRLNTIGIKASEINRQIGALWNREYPGQLKDYQNPNFRKVEKLYNNSRDAVADLLDLTNLASRLQDYIGKKMKENSKDISLNEVVDVKPNFMGIGINFNALFNKFFKKK
ncbi:MAG: hypothetical protein C0412_17210 [Flavobacterium sp.]|nr:hypothetical protein [Flavobacterium sp.]